jgi:hypothetical protein
MKSVIIAVRYRCRSKKSESNGRCELCASWELVKMLKECSIGYSGWLEAKEAGADYVGLDEYTKKLRWLDGC